MRKIWLLIAVVFSLGVFGVTTVQSVHAEDVVVDKALKQFKKDVSDFKKGDNPDEDKATIQKKLGQPDMDWVNQRILVNYKAYHEKAGLTDWGKGIANVISDMFTSFNQYIVYGLFDKALSTTFDLAKITSGIDDIFKKVGKSTTAIWLSPAMKGVYYLVFGVAVAWVFVQLSKSGQVAKAIISLILSAVVGGAYIQSGSTVLTAINDYTSKVQTAVFTATASSDPNSFQDTGATFRDTIRKQYFDKSIVRPFTLNNYGKATMDEAEKAGNDDKLGDPYRLIGGHVIDETISNIAKNNKYIAKDGGYEWYQATISFMSPIMSVAYGLPLLAIGVANVAVQLGAVLFYYLAPFTLLLSLIPKFSNKFLETTLQGIGLLFLKIGLLFAIMFVNWVSDLADIIVPVNDTAGAFFNSIFYILIMFLLYKNRKWLVSTVSGSTAGNAAMDKMGLSNLGRNAKNAGQSAASGARKVAMAGLAGYGGFKFLQGKVNDREANRYKKEQEEKEEKKRARERRGERSPEDYNRSRNYRRATDNNELGGQPRSHEKAPTNNGRDNRYESTPTKPTYKRETGLKTGGNNNSNDNGGSNMGDYLAKKRAQQAEEQERLQKDLR